MKTKYSILSLLIIFISSSCEKDFLDKNPLDTVSNEIFWQTAEEVDIALAGVYSKLQENFLGYERVYFDGISDNAFLDPGNSNQNNLSNMATGSISASLGGAIPNMYNTPYKVIVACNYFLDNVDRAPVSEEVATRYKAEVRFIRALSYFDLVQLFGGVIIYENFPETLEEVKIAKNTQEEVYRFIEADLNYAINHLPAEEYMGHAVQGSAEALLGRVLITQKKWNEALVPLSSVISSGNFSLANDYKSIFLTEGQNNPDINREIIFATQYLAPNDVHRTSPGSGGLDIELGWFSLMQPYDDLLESYQMLDGKMPEDSELYDDQNPFDNRDPRLDYTVKLPGEDWVNDSGEVWEGSYESYTGYLTEKYVDLSRAPFSSSTANSSDQDYIHLRYADVLLMYAEAQNEVSGPSESIFNALDIIRSRESVEMPAVNRSELQDQGILRNYIRRERRVELALEGQRYNDLKRWNIAHVKLPTLENPLGRPLEFEQKNYVLPFPSTELDNNPELEQNPGY